MNTDVRIGLTRPRDQTSRAVTTGYHPADVTASSCRFIFRILPSQASSSLPSPSFVVSHLSAILGVHLRVRRLLVAVRLHLGTLLRARGPVLNSHPGDASSGKVTENA
ncbi:hypothetical protein MRX96_007289 [Rhipicephalus microplus]